MVKAVVANATCKGLEGVDETPSSFGSVSEKVLSICQQKAKAVPQDHPFDVVLVTLKDTLSSISTVTLSLKSDKLL